MKIFKVYRHPVFGYAAIKVGISYPALLLGWIWLIANGIRGLGVFFLFLPVPLILLLAFALDALQVTSPNIGIIFLLGYSIALIIPAFKGNKWLANKYEIEGYKLIRLIQADNKKSAIALAENDNLEG